MVELDPESGETIDEFHELAAIEFANLNREFATQQVVKSTNAGMAEKLPESETVIESGPASHGSDDGETIPESQI